MQNKKVKTAIFHAFFKEYGGAENLIFDMRNGIKADLFAGAVSFFHVQKNSQDSYSKNLFDPNFKLTFLHKDSKIPIWKWFKRQLFFLFSPKIKELLEYQNVIFSGNIFFVQTRLKKMIRKRQKLDSNFIPPKLILYCHTPPRPLTDQFEKNLKKVPKILHFLVKFLRQIILNQYRKDCKNTDQIITNSKNIKNRLDKHLQIKADKVITPFVDLDKFKFINFGDYFFSFARLEELKRIKLIVKTFEKNPNLKLKICSTGPLKTWLEDYLSRNQIKNIEYLGLVSDQKLKELVGNCLATIYIPEDEDFGITQLESMLAGKPVIGVKEGGLLETVIDQKTGFLIPANPKIEDLTKILTKITPKLAQSMKQDCINQAKKFSRQRFFLELNEVL